VAKRLAPVVSIPKKPLNRTLTAYLDAHSPCAAPIPPFYETVPAKELRSGSLIDRMLGPEDQGPRRAQPPPRDRSKPTPTRQQTRPKMTDSRGFPSVKPPPR
jgi:hypothetical protein